MLAGNEMPAHAVAGEITLQCIEGRIALECDSGARELVADQLVHMAGQKMHTLRGMEHASLLLTIILKR